MLVVGIFEDNISFGERAGKFILGILIMSDLFVFYSWTIFVLIKQENLHWNSWILGVEMIFYDFHQVWDFPTMRPHWMMEELWYINKN